MECNKAATKQQVAKQQSNRGIKEEKEVHNIWMSCDVKVTGEWYMVLMIVVDRKSLYVNEEKKMIQCGCENDVNNIAIKTQEGLEKCELWKCILKLDKQIGINDDLFDPAEHDTQGGVERCDLWQHTLKLNRQIGMNDDLFDLIGA
eukprot:1154958-Ditylum_brightwellii.AAC.1